MFSWHGINGEDGNQVLPGILITTINPHHFIGLPHTSNHERKQHKEKMLLIPLKKTCKTSSDVTDLIEKIIKDLVEKKGLSDFTITKELKAGAGKTLIDCLILEPNFCGLGVDIKHIIKYLSE